jgi:hypothetical protein
MGGTTRLPALWATALLVVPTEMRLRWVGNGHGAVPDTRANPRAGGCSSTTSADLRAAAPRSVVRDGRLTGDGHAYAQGGQEAAHGHGALAAGYHPSTPMPLVLNRHGSQSTGLDSEVFSGMDATANAITFIVAYPQGDIPSGGGFEQNVPGKPLFAGAAMPACAPDNVAFLEQRHCVDEYRVFAIGFSGGARMASQPDTQATSRGRTAFSLACPDFVVAC